jgi:hypothetical protein
VPIFSYGKKKTRYRACNRACAAGFRADRAAGLIYGPFTKPGGGWYMGAEDCSLAEGRCAYCGDTVVMRVAFTPEELPILQKCAYAVWSELACDAIVSLAEAKGKNPESYSLSRAEVLEMVFDASRLEQYLKRRGHHALAVKISHTALATLHRAVRPAFTYSRYGL